MSTRLVARVIDTLLVGGVLLIAAIPLAAGLTHAVHTVHYPDGTSTTTFAHGAVARAYGLARAGDDALSMLYDVGAGGDSRRDAGQAMDGSAGGSRG